MSISAFGVENGDISKAGLGSLGTKIGAKIGGGLPGATAMSGARLGSKVGTTVADAIAPIKAKIVAGGLKPIVGGQLTPAGVGYAAGAAGLGTGLALKGNNNNNNKVNKSAFGVDDDRLSKADHRKTKYAVAGAAGTAAGAHIGAGMGAKQAGTDVRSVAGGTKRMVQGVARRSGGDRKAVLRGVGEGSKALYHQVPAFRGVARGGVIGGAAGLAAGVGALGAARHGVKNRRD